jgi:hypothetical protein
LFRQCAWAAVPDLKDVEQAQSGPAQINVVLNWFEELKQKVHLKP